MLKGLNAVVTGGSRGIGREIALKLARSGANIFIPDIVISENTEQTLSDCRALGVQAEAMVCDVSSFEAVGEFCSRMAKEFGGVDILVNNAGITRDGLLGRMSEENFDAVIATNLKGAFNFCRNLYRNFLGRKSGRIINISSVVGLNGNIGQVNYSAAKAGLIGLTKSVAKELAARNVTCNAIAPGFIQTAMTDALTPEVRAQYEASIPLKRLGSPEDIANLALFLCSPSASYITGEVIRCDGGLAM